MIELVSIHVPKTAGTAFKHTLQEVYGKNQVLLDYHQKYSPKQLLPPEAKVIHGHFSATKYQNYFSQAKRIVWLRHPLFRILSDYFNNYLPKDKRPKMNPKLLEKDLTLLEFAQFPGKSNFMAKQLSGMNLQQFYFVGIQEFYGEDMQQLIELMKWPKVEVKTKITNPDTQYFQQFQQTLADQKLIKQLIKLNQDDVALYHQALELRAKRQQTSVLLQYTLAENQRAIAWLQPMQQQVRQLSQQVQQIKTQRQSLKAMKLLRANPTELKNYLVGFWLAIGKLTTNQAETESAPKKITVQGWVIGKDSPAAEVMFCSDTNIIAKTPIDQTRSDVAEQYPHESKAISSGFMAEISVEAMSKIAKLNIFAVLENQTKVQIGQIQSVS